ncbi:hypothetical protein AB205_0083760 [Aquarana catesbeiana]|uniref:Uncharacterized protein n=1 Tax=Aquarana catesbeiana TaxID=8400 RepID=A0A2G9RCP2_AQUCT|nr:hypothetical protein AB205_0083760 [Aquarana catesbeiana]
MVLDGIITVDASKPSVDLRVEWCVHNPWSINTGPLLYSKINLQVGRNSYFLQQSNKEALLLQQQVTKT